MINQAKTYNDLIPPENSAYPWVANNWQLLCYYCCEPIFQEAPVAGYRQCTLYMRGRWHHGNVNGEIRCDPSKIRPDSEIDDPHCHVCGSQTVEGHSGYCSFRGKPVYRATSMSNKEREIERVRT